MLLGRNLAQEHTAPDRDSLFFRGKGQLIAAKVNSALTPGPGEAKELTNRLEAKLTLAAARLTLT
jgi:hypothetical protein